MDRQSISKAKTTNNELANKVSLNRQNENSSDVKYSETINSKNNSISNSNSIGLFNHDFGTVVPPEYSSELFLLPFSDR